MRANKRDSCFSNFRTVVVFLAFNATIFVLVAVGLAQTWFDELPVSIRAKVLWSAGHETSNMHEWTMPQFVHAGGGIFNTGEPEVIAQAAQVAAHSGQWSAQTTITNAVRAQNGPRAVRLMRWTNRAWDDQGRFFPNAAYYSTWIYLPHIYNPNKYPPWDPGDGGWWNIFQFKSPDQNDVSQPMFTLNVDHDDVQQRMSLYLYSKYNTPSSYSQVAPVTLPAGKWLHLEAYYLSATGPHGQIAIWQDGRLILQANDVVTSLGGVAGADTHPIWGIGNYTDHIAGDPAGEGTATVLFDDCAVSLVRLSRRFQVEGLGEATSE